MTRREPEEVVLTPRSQGAGASTPATAVRTVEFLCIGCPLGCHLEVDAVGEEIVDVRGYSCKVGERFARQEFSDPRRALATTVAIQGGRWPRLPVRSREPIPKALLREASAYLHTLSVATPVAMGDVIAEDLLGTGIDVVATRSMQRSEP